MKMCVLVASVPDTASVIRVGATGTRIDEAGIKWIISPYDEYALEEAVKTKESKGGEVHVLAYGPDRVETTMRECFARGADGGTHVRGGEATFGDSLAIARVLAAAIAKVGPFDLILAGAKGVGSDNSLVGAMVAELLDLPHVGSAIKLTLGEGELLAEREFEGGTEVVAAPLPCVVTAQKGLNEPRYPSLKGIMASKRVAITTLAVSDLGLDEGTLAGTGATTRWRTLELPAAKTGGVLLTADDNPAAAAAELARLLREQAKAI